MKILLSLQTIRAWKPLLDQQMEENYKQGIIDNFLEDGSLSEFDYNYRENPVISRKDFIRLININPTYLALHINEDWPINMYVADLLRVIPQI